MALAQDELRRTQAPESENDDPMTLKTLIARLRAALNFRGSSAEGGLHVVGRISPEGMEILHQLRQETQTKPDPYAKTNDKIAELREATNDLGLIIMQIRRHRDQSPMKPLPVDDDIWRKLEERLAERDGWSARPS